MAVSYICAFSYLTGNFFSHDLKGNKRIFEINECKNQFFSKKAKHDRQLSYLYVIIQKKRKGGAAHENGTSHRHSVHPAPAGQGHRAGTGRAVRGIPPHHPAGHRMPLPGRDTHCHRPGHRRRHLDSRGIPGRPDGPHHPRDAGHPGRAAKPGQRQRHPALRPADGKALGRERQQGFPHPD